MRLFDWFKDKDNRDAAKTIVDIAKIIVPACVVVAIGIGTWLGFFASTDAPIDAAESPAIAVEGTGHAVNTGAGTQIVQGDNGTIINGYSIEQHEAALQRRLADLRGDLNRAGLAEKQIIVQELTAVTTQLADLQTSFQQAQEELRVLRLRLSEFDGQVPADRVQAAQQALFEGETELAKDLFAQAQDQLADQVVLAASAAFGLGGIAEADIRWADAALQYAHAARLDGRFEYLEKASEFAWRAGDYDAAFRFSADMIAAAKGGDTQIDLATALNAHAISAKALGEYDLAENLSRDALAIDLSTVGNNDPGYATLLNTLAAVLDDLGRYHEAEALYLEALDIDRATIGDRDPAYATRLNNLAGVVRAQGRHAEAETLLRDALEIDRATIGNGHPGYAIRLSNLAGVVRAQGRQDEAVPLYQEALEIIRATIGEAHPDYATYLNNLAAAVEEQGQYERAEALYRQALEIDRATIGPDHPNYAVDLINLAGVLMLTQQQAEAEPLLLQALQILEARLPADHPDVAMVRRNLNILTADDTP